MGTLDDAIRQHLALKRQHGADDDELKKQEDQAFGRGQPAPLPEPEAPAIEPEPVAAEPEPVAETVPEPIPEPIPEPAPVPAPPAPQPVARREPEPTPEPPSEPPSPQPEPNFDPNVEPVTGPSEEMLEERPSFLDETPDQDELWFEQKAPKDFDFGK